MERLRKSSAFIPQLSFVAESNSKIIAYLLLTRIVIQNDKIQHPSLSLAPIAVLPDFQKRGIGSKLIIGGLEVAKNLGFKSVIVLGDPLYYSRFGFIPSTKYDIRCPFDVPAENFMVCELCNDGLAGISGVVVYPQEFSEMNNG